MRISATLALSLLTLLGCTGNIDGVDKPGAVGGVTTPTGGSGSGAPTQPGISPAGLDAGRTVMRRLSRVEYNNTVRDLLGTALKPADAFPPDEVSEGFSTIGEYLAFSPLHAEQMEAASAQLIDELFARPMSDAGRTRILSCQPETGNEATCARQILLAFARRAFRRVPTTSEIDGLLTLADTARAGESYETGLKAALQAVLLSPHFIYRVERDKSQPSAERPATDDELATRLSYFLWSSMPDEALFAAADGRQLAGDGAELGPQIKRMLADPKALALVTGFGSQWLKLGRMSDPLDVDAAIFPGYDDALRVSSAQETLHFFDNLLRGNRPLTEVLTADYTFADARLAQHYGLPATGNSNGSELTQTSLAGTARRGILTQASVLLGTSLATRTSPVKRGVWVLEQLLCVTPPPPPANLDIPQLPAPVPGATLRRTLEQHRQNPVCAGCHAVMDPMGLGLENFDGIGRYRETENGGAAVDASGTYENGQKFVGAGELAALLAADERFPSCVTEQLLTYAVGRSFKTPQGAAYAATLAHETLGAGNGRWLSWISSIATSKAFRTRSGDTP